MSYRVVFLKAAEQDLKELKQYIVRHFGNASWQATLAQLKTSVQTLQIHPQAGSIPDELRTLNPGQYRQILCGMNRIIYEIRRKNIYIHIICDSRRDMQGLLMRRMLRGESQ